jgi:hypothetical protein
MQKTSQNNQTALDKTAKIVYNTDMKNNNTTMKENEMKIDTTKTYNVTYMNTITPHYWNVERYGEYPHFKPVRALQVSGNRLAEMVANGGYFYNSTYPALEILKIEKTHEVTWEMVTSNGRWSAS